MAWFGCGRTKRGRAVTVVKDSVFGEVGGPIRDEIERRVQ